jgi:hypothetical protein
MSGSPVNAVTVHVVENCGTGAANEKYMYCPALKTPLWAMPGAMDITADADEYVMSNVAESEPYA